MVRRNSRKIPLGGWLIFAAFLLLLSLLQLVSNSNLLSQGVTTQAVVLSEGPAICGQGASANTKAPLQSFSIQFTDQSGSQRTGTISRVTTASIPPLDNRSRSSTIRLTRPPSSQATRSSPVPQSGRSLPS